MSDHSTGELRNLPSVDRLLADPRVEAAQGMLSRGVLTDIARQVLADLRHSISQGSCCPSLVDIAMMVTHRAQGLGQSIKHVINATGVVLHTNLGRAPMSDETIAAMAAASRGYVNLELDLESGTRGSRQAHIEPLLCQLTGAEAAFVVNNNASAVLLGLMALCKGKEVVVSRGQAVQIGGGVRIPDIMKQSGAKLVEVGTTNVTEVADYAEAITPKTAALLRVHSSNFKIIGFTEHTGLQQIVALANLHNLHALDDLGSGCLLDTRKYGLAFEPMVQESVSTGSDLVFFSGDKLLGGPQAGLIVGEKPLIEKLKKHPLARTVRIDKTRLAGLVQTLLHYARGEAESKIPVWQMISLSQAATEIRAKRWAAEIGSATAEKGESLIGGGSLPGSTLPTWLVVLRETARSGQRKALPEVVKRLRATDPAVICRIEQDRLLLDPRTVLPGEDDALISAVRRETSGIIRA